GGTGLTNGVNHDLVGGNGNPVIDPRFATTTPVNNGGPTPTLALQISSPALRRGSNPANLPNDQRGPGFPRTTSGLTDIGSFQVGSVLRRNGHGIPKRRQRRHREQPAIRGGWAPRTWIFETVAPEPCPSFEKGALR